ncbi:MAG: ATP phosphoribosyltransferase [Thermomicrobiales bacterium]
MTNADDILRLAISSKGEFEIETRRFLDSAGLPVRRPNPRQYTGRVGNLPDTIVLFQRTADIVAKVADGSVDIGITGYDIVAEYCQDDDDVIVLLPKLGFRAARLVVAVPSAWLDVVTLEDLADLSVDFKRRGRALRVVTKFPHLTREFFHRHGVTYFTLVSAEGALEAAPAMGYGDLIVDITETGVTLRDNHLKMLDGGTVLQSQACLIGNRRALAASARKRESVRQMLEHCEARLRTQGFYVLNANIQGESEAAVARHVIAQGETAGAQGPTIARVFPKDARQDNVGLAWFAVNLIVEAPLLLRAVDHLRRAGANGITVVRPDYVFDGRSAAYEQLLRELGLVETSVPRAALV